MLKSMTAYGRASVISSVGKFVVELQSVNRKHLEVNTFLPKELLRYDSDIKKWIAQEVGRGQVNAKISVSFERTSPLVVTPNLAVARQVKSAWEVMAKDLKVALSTEQLWSLLSAQEDILLYDEDVQDEEIYRQALHEAVSQALQHFVAMKVYEGKVLHEDIMGRFKKLGALIKEIAAKCEGTSSRFRQKLLERLQEVMGASLENEERVLREVCVYAERIDIAEELTRFNSHLSQVEMMLQQRAQPDKQGIGKTLEFMVQELNREINTIGSKSSEIDISRAVIEIKSELERIREQIQNIE